jgi:succinoglycan biosynthesis protein ExoO
MRFVFVTDELPQPGLSGHLALNHAIIAWLREGRHEVDILLTRPRFRWPVQRFATAPVAGPGIAGWGNFVFARHPRAAMAILARQILSKLPAGDVLVRRARAQSYGVADAHIGATITPAQSAWCACYIRASEPDAILIDTIFRAPVLAEPGLQQFNSVILAPDLFHRRHRAMRAAGYRVYPPQLSSEDEGKWLGLAKAIAAIQPEEAAQIRVLCPAQPVFITALPALPCPPPLGNKKRPGRLVFVGSDTLPNLDGLRWFFAEIWPRLQNTRPGVTLDLVGDCGAALGRLPAGVNRLGRVKSHSGILHRAMLAIAPLRVNSGLKIKILDYARHGLVTVLTPDSLRGFAADPEAPFRVAADASAFADAVMSKLAEPDPDDAQRALQYVAKHYNTNVSFSGLAVALRLPKNTPEPVSASKI